MVISLANEEDAEKKKKQCFGAGNSLISVSMI